MEKIDIHMTLNTLILKIILKFYFLNAILNVLLAGL